MIGERMLRLHRTDFHTNITAGLSACRFQYLSAAGSDAGNTADPPFVTDFLLVFAAAAEYH
ncbi:MAG: hypothetical protein ACOX41_08325 [Anaerovoracaceae bacterium]|jgi:hypothetical protein